MPSAQKPVSLEDDTKETITLLTGRRIPWLMAGLLGGIVLTFISSKFEYLLSVNISIAFFIPVIVYMSDAVGTQSQSIFIRNSAKERINFPLYLLKESAVGTLLGFIFGLVLGIFALLWLKSSEVAFSVGLAMLANMALAPLVALTIPRFLQIERTDPALGSGPFSTILQDLISLSIYLLIASLIISSGN